MVICNRLLDKFFFSIKLFIVSAFAATVGLLFDVSTANAQLSGSYAIGSGQFYPNLDSVLRDLNRSGVSGSVIIQIPSGYSEQVPVGGFRLGSNVLNSTLNSVNTLSFQKAGLGANPIIYSNIGSVSETFNGLADVVWALEGVDYVSINNIDIIDTNTNNSVLLSSGIGIGFFKYFNVLTSQYDGCQHNEIFGCRFQMQGNLNENSTGISFDNRLISSTARINSTATNESNSYNSIKGCYFDNIGNPVFFRGNTVLNYAYWDQFNVVGGSNVGDKNFIYGWGASNSNSYAIYFGDQLNGHIENNIIENEKVGSLGSNLHIGGTKYALYLINSSSLYNENVNHYVKNNTIVWSNGLGSASFVGIYSHYNGGDMIIDSNDISVQSSDLTTGDFYGILYENSADVNGGINKTSSCNFNTISGVFNSSIGSFYGIYLNNVVQQTTSCNFNNVKDLIRTGLTSGVTYCLNINGNNNYNILGYTTNIVGNQIQDISFGSTQTTGNIYLLDVNGNYNLNILNNSVRRVFVNSSNANGALFGIYTNYYASIVNCNNNVVDSLFHLGTGSYNVYGIYDYMYYCSKNYFRGNKITNIKCFGSSANLYAWYKFYIGGEFIANANKIAGITMENNAVGNNFTYGVYALNAPGAYGNLGNLWSNNIISVGNSLNGISSNIKSNGGVYGYFALNTYTNQHSLFNNTFYNFGTSVFANYSNIVIYSQGINQSFDLRNNIIVNMSNNLNSSPNGRIGLIRLPSNLNANSNQFNLNCNSNNYYLNSNNLTYSAYLIEGAFLNSSFNSFINRVLPREINSFSENTSFKSTNWLDTNFLSINANVLTQCESGGDQSANLISDYYGNARFGNISYSGTGRAMDVGAEEFEGASPIPTVDSIKYTPDGQQCNATSRTISCIIHSNASIDSVQLKYSFNGVAQGFVLMSTTDNVNYTGTIPAANPVNANVSFSVIAKNTLGFIKEVIGTSYSDAPYTGVNLVLQNSIANICTNDSTVLSLFTNGPSVLPQGYSNSYAINDADEDLFGLSLGNGSVFNNTSSCGVTGGSLANGLPASVLNSYSNYTSTLTPINLQAGQVIPFSMVIGFCSGVSYSNTSAIYLDLNRNGVFDLPTEQLYISGYNNGNSIAGASFTRSGIITIPSSGIVPGYTLMRVVVNESNIVSPNGVYAWGETEDYIVNLKGILSANYDWSDNGVAFGGNAITQNYKGIVSGSHIISVLGTDSKGCTVSSQDTIVVLPRPALPSVVNGIHCGLDISKCYVISNSGASNPKFNWYDSTNQNLLLQSSTNIHYTTPFTKTTSFWVAEESQNGCVSQQKALITDTVILPDTISVTQKTVNICAGNAASIGFQQNGTYSNNYSFTWQASSVGSGLTTNANGGNSLSPLGITVTPTASGSYNYIIKGSNVVCQLIDSVNVIVNPNPVIVYSELLMDSVCSNDSIAFTAQAFVPTLGGNSAFPSGYSSSKAQFANHSDIYSFEIVGNGNKLTNISACNGQGASSINGLPASIIGQYSNYTNLSKIAVCDKNKYCSFSIQISNCDIVSRNSQVAIYIDLDRNGSFSNPAEQVYLSSFGTHGSINGNKYTISDSFVINNNASIGYTLMRVIVSESLITSPTTTYNYGETEDYKIVITNPTSNLNYTWSEQSNGSLSNKASDNLLWNFNSGNFMLNVTVVDASTTCSSVSSNLPFKALYVPSAPSVIDGNQCGFGVSSASVISNSIMPSPIYVWYNDTLTNVSLQDSSINFYAKVISVSDTLYVTERTNLCEGKVRVPILLNVNPAPFVSLSSNYVLCNNEIRSITPLQGQNLYNTFNWTSSNILFTDSLATVPYTTNTNSQRVFVKGDSIAFANLNLTAFDSITGCIDTVKTIVKNQPKTGETNSVYSNMCSVRLNPISLLTATPVWNNLIFWDTCGFGNAFSPVSNGFDNITLNVNASTIAKVNVKNDLGQSCFSIVDTLVLNTAAINSVTNALRCGDGVVDLKIDADTTKNIIRWYNNVSASGSPINLGLTYSPYVTKNENFYVQTQNGFGDNKYTLSSTINSATAFGYILDFDVTNPIKLDSIYLFSQPNVINHYSVFIRNGRGYNQIVNLSGWNLLDTGSLYTTSSIIPTAIPFDFNADFSVGNYSILILTSNYIGHAPGVGTSMNQVDVQNGDFKLYETLKCLSGFGGSSLNFSIIAQTKFAGKIVYTKSEPCLSNVSTVAAIVKRNVPITLTASSSSLCYGSSDTLQVQSSNNNYAYTWSQGQVIGKKCIVSSSNLSNNSQLINVSVDAVDTSLGLTSGCGASAQIMIPVNQMPTAISLTPANITSNVIGTPSLVTTLKDSTTNILSTILGSGNLRNTSLSYPAPFGLSNGLLHEQYLIRKSELLGLGMHAGVSLNSISFNIDSICNHSQLYKNYQIKLGHTAQSSMTGLINSAFETCYTSINGFGPKSKSWYLLKFDSVFVWNGNDNIVVDVTFNNCTNCGQSLSCQTDSSLNDVVLQTSTNFNSTYSVYGNNDCSILTLNPNVLGNSFMQRPNMRFTFIDQHSNSHLWSPSTYIYRDAMATLNYFSGSIDSLYIMPPSPANNPYVYIVKNANPSSQCNSLSNYRVNVDSFPLNYSCSTAQVIYVNPTCIFTQGSSKWGWYDPSVSPTTPSVKTTASCGNADDDVWYKFYLPAGASTVTINVKGGLDFDPAFELDSGTCSGFTSIACVDASNSINNSQESYVLVNPKGFTGGVFYLRVYDSRVGFGSGDFSICLQGILPVPFNDNVCNAGNFSSNYARWGGSGNATAYSVSAYDNGATLFMGSASHFSDNPPYGVNCVYFSGSTTFATNQGADEPIPPCAVVGSYPKTLWFKFRAPTMGGVDVTLRTLFNGNPTNFNNYISAYILSKDPCTGVPNYTNIGCSTNGVLSFTALGGVLSQYAGQFVYVQLGGSGASSPFGDYVLSIQAIPSNITLTNPTTSSLTVNLPSVPGCSQISVQWQKVGATGYSFTNVSSSVNSYLIKGISSGANYTVWAKYSNAIQSYYSTTKVMGTTVGCSAAPSGPTIIPAINHCGKDTIEWPGHVLATGSVPYRIYWGVVGSTGYNLQSVPASAYNPATGKVRFVISNLQPNQSYYFYYRVLCVGGAQTVSNITTYTQCNGPAKLQAIVPGAVKFNDRVFVNSEISEIIAFSDTVANANAVHTINLESVSEESLNLNFSDVKSEWNFTDTNFDFELIPNPASDNVLIKSNINADENAEVLIMNLQGEIVSKLDWRSRSNGNGQTYIDLQTLVGGVYMVSFSCKQGTVIHKLVVVH